jgi:hypothetical protein
MSSNKGNLMSAEIPKIVQAGDTIDWTVDYSDEYPSSEWSLTLYIKQIGQLPIALTTASAIDDTFTVSYTDTQSALLPEGNYTWVAKVNNGLSTFTVETGSFNVIPDLSTTDANYDARSFNQRMMEALEAVLENRATDDILEQTIGGRTFKSMSRAELVRQYSFFKRAVATEKGIKLFKPVYLL